MTFPTFLPPPYNYNYMVLFIALIFSLYPPTCGVIVVPFPKTLVSMFSCQTVEVLMCCILIKCLATDR